MFKGGDKRLWRPLIVVVVAYAVAAQSLLITVGGFAALARADTAATAFVLCTHDSAGAPARPADAPNYPRCNHCIFCFAASHHAVIDAPPLMVHRVAMALIDAPWAADRHCPPRIRAHSIANPRGPPPLA